MENCKILCILHSNSDAEILITGEKLIEVTRKKLKSVEGTGREPWTPGRQSPVTTFPLAHFYSFFLPKKTTAGTLAKSYRSLDAFDYVTSSLPRPSLTSKFIV